MARLLLTVILLVGCATGGPRLGRVPLAAEGEPLGLLPAGLRAVVDVDVKQIRAWPLRGSVLEGRRWRDRITLVGMDPIADIDDLAAAVLDVGEQGDVVVVARGRFSIERLRSTLGADVESEEYRGATVHWRRVGEGSQPAFALLDGGMLASGSRATVRRVIDVARGDETGFARATVTDQAHPDRALAACLMRSPSAKSGRVAIRAAVSLGSAERRRAGEAGLPGQITDAVRWVSVALAVGNGADLGLVLGARDATAATELERFLRAWIDRAKGSVTLRTLGIAPYLESVKTGIKEGEVHVGFWLDGRRLLALLDRIDGVLGLVQGDKK